MRSPTAASPGALHRLTWSNLAAQSAEQIALAAAPIVAVLSLGAGAAQTGLLQTTQTLPFLLLAVPAGVAADRVSRSRLMLLAEGMRVASLAATLALITFHRLTLPLLALLGFTGAAGTVAYSVAAPALVPALVARAALASANGRLELARSVAFTAGPAVAGALVGWAGGGPAFALAAALSMAAACLLAGIPEPHRPGSEHHAASEQHLVHGLRAGGTFVLGHPLLRPIVMTAVVFNTSFFMLQAVYVPYAVHHLNLGSSGVGATLGAYGAGMVAGAVLAPRVTRALPFGAVVLVGPMAGLAAAAVLALTIWLPWPMLAGLAWFLIGAGPMLWVISTTTLRQAVTPARLLGRASAVITTATYGSRPLGAAVGAAVGGVLGVNVCLIAAAVGFLAQAIIILASPVPRLERQPGLESAA
jgi:predicted MFS family arabinose efflux permease